jgi:hypothetical protein
MKFIVALALVGSVTSAHAQSRLLAKPVPPNASIIQVQNVMCGIPPIPPIGCRGPGVCVCDQTGQRCSWQFNCN